MNLETSFAMLTGAVAIWAGVTFTRKAITDVKHRSTYNGGAMVEDNAMSENSAMAEANAATNESAVTNESAMPNNTALTIAIAANAVTGIGFIALGVRVFYQYDALGALLS